MADIIKLKNELRKDMINLYKSKGYDYTVRSINNLVKNSNKKSKEVGQPQLAIQIRGECCEILLELAILEYSRRKNLPWICSKGLTLQRRDYKKGTTELDITLFTPAQIILFESKFRSGNIQLIDECRIVPDYGSVTDVYKQNMIHLDNLRRYLDSAVYNLSAGPPFALSLFIEPASRVKDNRTEKMKGMIPLISLDNITRYLDVIASKKQVVWDINKLHEILILLDSMSEENFKQHMKGVAKRGRKRN